MSAKALHIAPIAAKDANNLVKRLHYSGKVVNNSQLHFGVYWNGKLEGVLQFGPSMVKSQMIGLVLGTKWTGFIEINRMAFSEVLPRNSESRAISVCMNLIRKNYPHIEWVLSFADGTQCGDGTIYRAAGFILTDVRKNTAIIKLPSGKIATHMTYEKGKHILENNGKASAPVGSKKLPGFMFRYIYFLNPAARKRLTVPILPFSAIDEAGAGMYKGKPRVKQAMASQGHSGGVAPTHTLQSQAD
jgi:hypothetical protein